MEVDTLFDILGKDNGYCIFNLLRFAEIDKYNYSKFTIELIL